MRNPEEKKKKRGRWRKRKERIRKKNGEFCQDLFLEKWQMKFKIWGRLLSQFTSSTVMLHNNPRTQWLETTILFCIICLWISQSNVAWFQVAGFPQLSAILHLHGNGGSKIWGHYNMWCLLRPAFRMSTLTSAHILLSRSCHMAKPSINWVGKIHPTFSKRKYRVKSKRHGSPGGKGRRQLAFSMEKLGTKIVSTTVNSLIHQTRGARNLGEGCVDIFGWALLYSLSPRKQNRVWQ